MTSHNRRVGFSMSLGHYIDFNLPFPSTVYLVGIGAAAYTLKQNVLVVYIWNKSSEQLHTYWCIYNYIFSI